MTRGNRFALGEAPRRDPAGHSLPSDRSMRWVAVDLFCVVCFERFNKRRRLARFRVDSHHAACPVAIDEMGKNPAIKERVVTEPGGAIRFRYTFECRRCRHRPVRRTEHIEGWLRDAYEPGAVAKIVREFI